MKTERIVYDDKVVRQFLWASVVFALVGLLVGVVVALQLAFWPANVTQYFSFGRLRPLHTNAVIFAFVGNMIFAGVYYSTQRLTKQRMASDFLSKLHFWGWQAIIVAAAITLPLGFTQAKEYAELEWPIDLAVAVVWLAFGANFFLTLKKRHEKHLYVALWFYIATIITITVLYVVNNLALPVLSVAGLKSYSLFGGAQDALVQWWYGHNAVAFFLTTPILGIMYYFLPKAAERPVFSYRLSIIHFWSLVFIYIWAGPHHLLNTALPDWAQSLGMVFSVMLWAPSWGGMLNGLLTLRGAWDRLRRDPVLKFFAVGVTAYGMATFEGPLLSIKSVSGLSHYTDWIIAHVHNGALGWNGFMAAGLFYWLVPRLYGRELHSRAAANFHFWIGTIGIVLYVASMWVAGITQGLMWRAENEGGGLMYPSFLETFLALSPMYWARLVGGLLYLTGFVVMTWNLVATARAGKAVTTEIEVTVEKTEEAKVPWPQIAFGAPVLVSFAVMAVLGTVAVLEAVASLVMVILASGIALFFIILGQVSRHTGKPAWHSLLEGRAFLFSALTFVAIIIGGVAELVPSIISVPEQMAATRNVPYSALELEGRDIYISEGCYTCHSQMIRPFTWEAARYGQPNTMDDSIFDHPFQWGSRRIGPDLARVGGKYNHTWHFRHMLDPREISRGSNMPPYAHMAEDAVDFDVTADKMRAMRSLGVPYRPERIQTAAESAQRQHDEIVAYLTEDAGVRLCGDGMTYVRFGQAPPSGLSPDQVCHLQPRSELVALISYLQRLGNVPSQPAGDTGEGEVALQTNAADAAEVAR